MQLQFNDEIGTVGRIFINEMEWILELLNLQLSLPWLLHTSFFIYSKLSIFKYGKEIKTFLWHFRFEIF